MNVVTVAERNVDSMSVAALVGPNVDAMNAVVEPVGTVDGVDRESPAGPCEAEAGPGVRPRPGLPDFLFVGPGDGHWIGQRCDVLGCPSGDPSTRLVRLACGCRAHVPRASLQPG
jgi:hypothetical protein